MKEEIQELASVADELKALVDSGVQVNLDISVGGFSVTPGDPVDPDQPPVEPPVEPPVVLKRWKVDASSKNSKRVKIRPTPSPTVSEIAYAYHNDIVEEHGLPTLNGFENIHQASNPIIAGWVEQEYLIPV